MALADTIAADHAAVATAQAALDAANAQLAADQAQLAAAQPHLSLWQEVEAYAATIGTEAEANIKAFSDRAKALFGL